MAKNFSPDYNHSSVHAGYIAAMDRLMRAKTLEVEKIMSEPKTPFLDTIRTGSSPNGLPHFTTLPEFIVASAQTALVPFSNKLQLTPSRSEPLEVLYKERAQILPPQTQTPDWIGKQDSKTNIDHLIRAATDITNAHRLQLLKQDNSVPEAKKVTEKAIREKTETKTKRDIENLIGSRGQILDTFWVGDTFATEVIPHQRIDPLFCQRHGDRKEDFSFNTVMSGAFLLAFIGRLNSDQQAMKIAQETAKIGARLAFTTGIRFQDWLLAEELFISEIVFGDDQYLTNGFTKATISGPARAWGWGSLDEAF